MSIPKDIVQIYERAVEEDGRWPYAYGGGHISSFAPSPPVGGGPMGYDCGSFISMLIHAGNPTEMPKPLTTSGFTKWGLSGFGEFLAVRVFTGIHDWHVVDHCMLEFRKGFTDRHRYAMAHHTHGPNCGFVSSRDFDASFYHTRRKVYG